MAVATVEDILRGSLRDVENLAKVTDHGTKASRELLDELKEADRALAARLRQESKRFGGRDARFTGASAVAYQQQIRVQIAYLEKRLTGMTETQATKAVERSMKRSVRTLEALEERFVGVTRPVRLGQRERMSQVVAGNRASLLGQIPTSVDRYGTKMIAEFERRMRVGLVQGMTMDEMIGALTGHAGPDGRVSMAAMLTPDGVIRLREEDIPEGLFRRYRSWAERLVRTELAHSYNQARRVSYEAMREEMLDLQKKIVAILDTRTAPDSIAVNGQIRELDDYFVDGAGRRYLYPPARPNDRETTIPWRPAWNDEARAVADPVERAMLGELSEEDEDALIEKIRRNLEQQEAAKGKKKPAPAPAPAVPEPAPAEPEPEPAAPPVSTAPEPMRGTRLTFSADQAAGIDDALAKVSVTREQFAATFEAPPGYEVEVLGARTDFNGRTQKFVSVVKKDGVKIGTLNRSLTRSGGELEVYQAALFLDDSVQGSGVGSWMINRQFEMYEQLGVSVVDIAPAEVGRYYWAKVGYQMSDESKASYLEHFDEFSPKWGLSATKRKELRALFEADPTAFARSRDLPTVEYTDFDNRTHRGPVSKALFLDKSAPDWKGYLEPGTKEWREAREQLAAAAARPAKRVAEKRAAEEAAAEAEKIAAAKRAAEKRAAEEAAAAAVAEVGARGTRVKVGRLVQDDFEGALRGVALAPEEVKAAIEPPPGHELYITGVFEGSGRAEVMAKIYKGDREVGTLQRTFRRSDGELTVNQDAMFLDRAAQGTGTGTWMLNRQFDQYERMGVTTVDIHAAEVGRYYWTKVGYQMSYGSQLNYLEHFDEVASGWGIGDEQAADLRAMFERDPTEFARQHGLPEVTYTDQNGREARAPLNKALFLDKKSPTWYGSLEVGTPEWERAREFLGSKK